MKFTEKKDKEKKQGHYIITFETEEWKKIINKAKENAKNNLKIPGFRSGKVPQQMAEKHLSENIILNEAHKIGVDKAWKFALENKSEIKPFVAPDVVINKLSMDEYEILFKFDLRPEINIGNYKNIKIGKNKIELGPNDINNEIENLRNHLGVLQQKDGPVENGNVVIFDFKGFNNGKEFEGGKAENFELEIGSNKFIPGFEEQMIGLKAGDEKEITVTFPENYPQDDLAGKPVQFKLKIKEVKFKVLPELNDDLAKQSQLPGVETYAQLNEFIKTNLLQEKEKQEKDRYIGKLLKEIAKNSEIIIPESVITKEMNNLKKEFENSLQEKKIDLKQYFKITKTTEEDLDKELKKDAFDRLSNFLILDKIEEQENINITKKEIENEVNKFAKLYKISDQEIEQLVNQDSVIETLKRQKLITYLYEVNE